MIKQVSKHIKTLWYKRVEEFYKKEILTESEKDSLLEMIDSPDNQNFTVVETAIKTFIKEKLVCDLNEGQTKAFHEIINFLDNPQHDALVLKGYAGTGKTFLVKRIIEYIAQTDYKKSIAIGAPTNKAVQVLYKDSPKNVESLNAYILDDIFDANSRLVYSTVHKLLGMKEVITDSGEQLFKADGFNDSKLSNYDYLMVDEVSMLGNKLCDDIMMFSKTTGIIFFGDPCQIPPVKCVDSIPFSKQNKYNFKVVELSEIMRQKSDNPIIKLSFEIRNNINKMQPVPVLKTELNDNEHGVICMNSTTDKPLVRPLLQQYFNSNDFKCDGDYMKVIAWRNNTISYINNEVRTLLYGVNPPTYIVGERLIVNKPIFHKVTTETKRKVFTDWRVLFYTSEEIEIKSIEVVEIRLDEMNFFLQDTLNFYKLEVLSHNPMRNAKNDVIHIIHESSVKDYNKKLQEAKNMAITMASSQYWKKYYDLQKWSAGVTYNYAITAHKSQGSTYKNVLILEDDLDKNLNVVERNRIKYTVCSRASEKLFILRKNS